MCFNFFVIIPEMMWKQSSSSPAAVQHSASVTEMSQKSLSRAVLRHNMKNKVLKQYFSNVPSKAFVAVGTFSLQEETRRTNRIKHD